MHWSQFWTILLQAGIVFIIIVIVAFVGSAIFMGIRDGMKGRLK